MVRLIANNEMIGSWWQFNASDITSSTFSRYASNPSYHNTETRNRLAAPGSCSRNADLFTGSISPSSSPLSPSTPGSLGVGAIVGIVVGVVGGKFRSIRILFN